VDSGISAIAVACGSHHTMVIKPGIDNNEVWGAGHNSSGQLGIGSYVSQSTFVSSGNAFEAVSSAIAISCCAHAVHIIKADNTVWGAGANQSGQLSNGGTIKKYDFVQSLDSNSNAISALAVAGGALHTAVIKSDNTVWTVGYNNYGQLGQGHDGGSNVLFDSIDPVINGLYVHPEMIGVIDPSELP
jgi:alpha-tubulin suppressor-like RCC1 family protein